MKSLLRSVSLAALALFFVLSMTSCSVIGDIFKAGAYTGIIGVIVVIALLIWLVSKMFGGGGGRSA